MVQPVVSRRLLPYEEKNVLKIAQYNIVKDYLSLKKCCDQFINR